MTKMARLQRPLTIALGLTAAVVLASCSQSGSAPSTAPSGPPSASPPAAPSAGKRIDITVKGKQVTPAPSTVDIAVGESLTIAVTSDVDNTLHAHGFEIEKDIKAGQRTEITVKGAQTGAYEFELHHPELRLFQVAVR